MRDYWEDSGRHTLQNQNEINGTERVFEEMMSTAAYPKEGRKCV
jgi:hypothetical protein